MEGNYKQVVLLLHWDFVLKQHKHLLVLFTQRLTHLKKPLNLQKKTLKSELLTATVSGNTFDVSEADSWLHL